MKLIRAVATWHGRKINRRHGTIIIILIMAIAIAAILSLIIDDYTAAGMISESQIFWHEPPETSRAMALLIIIGIVIISPWSLPMVYYQGPTGSPKISIAISSMIDEDIVEIRTVRGHKIQCHKNRIKRYGLAMILMGEYKIYQGDGEKTIIAEGEQYEVTESNILRKRLLAAEEEASLWRIKYMQLIRTGEKPEPTGGKDDGEQE